MCAHVCLCEDMCAYYVNLCGDMYVYMCICVRICVCMCVLWGHVYVCAYMSVWRYVRTCVSAWGYVCAYVSMWGYVCVFLYGDIYVYICVCVGI